MADPVAGGHSKWSAVTGALLSFVQQPLDGTSVGLQYFGIPAQFHMDSCTASDYARPDVEIGAIAQTASQIRTSIGNHGPSTGTPTSAALQGAIDHARAWAAAHEKDVVAVVLATDGEPTECETGGRAAPTRPSSCRPPAT